MNQTRAKIYLLVLVLAFSGLLFSQLTKPETPPQPKQQIAQKASDEKGAVLAGCGGDLCYTLWVKDNSSKNIIENASVTLNSPRDIWFCFPGDGGDWTFGFSGWNWNQTVYYGNYGLVCQLNPSETLPSQLNITLSKSGYTSKTTTIPTSAAATVFLDKVNTTENDNQQTTTTPSNSTANSTANTTSSSITDIKDVSLPKIFGGASTNLAKITDTKKVKGLTIEVKGRNKVIWNEVVDLSSQDTANKFKSLNKYLIADKTGVVNLDSKVLKVLNKKATITMSNLPFLSTPKILVNGKEDKDIVSNINYKDNTLSFDAAHFSKFEAVPTLTITEPKSGFETSEENITLKGTISDPQATVSASLNGRDLGNLDVATSSGQFNKDLSLTEGKNTIIVSALSAFGATQSATISGTLLLSSANLIQILVIVGIIVIVVGASGAGYYLYKRRKTKIAQPEKPPQI